MFDIALVIISAIGSPILLHIIFENCVNPAAEAWRTIEGDD